MDMVLTTVDHFAAIVAIVQWVGPGVVVVTVHFISRHPRARRMMDRVRGRDTD